MSLFLGIFLGVMSSLMILSVEKCYKYFGSKNNGSGHPPQELASPEKDVTKDWQKKKMKIMLIEAKDCVRKQNFQDDGLLILIDQVLKQL